MTKLSPTKKALWRSHLTSAADVAEDFRQRRDYTQQRPYTGLGLPPSEEQEDDCSAYTAKSFFLANKKTGLSVRDPLGAGFNRSGNTDTCYSFMTRGGGKRLDVSNPKTIFFPGDVAIFDNPYTGRRTDHMMFCSHKGTNKTAKWSSHGHESSVFYRDAPEEVTLFYARSVFTIAGVFRPTELL